MQRSFGNLANIAAGRVSAGSDVARDALFHFFQDAYHLKDWLVNDETVALPRRDVESAITELSRELAICADLCNGTKHRILRRTRTGDEATAFTGQSVTVQVGTFRQVARIGRPKPNASPDEIWVQLRVSAGLWGSRATNGRSSQTVRNSMRSASGKPFLTHGTPGCGSSPS